MKEFCFYTGEEGLSHLPGRLFRYRDGILTPMEEGPDDVIVFCPDDERVTEDELEYLLTVDESDGPDDDGRWDAYA